MWKWPKTECICIKFPCPSSPSTNPTMHWAGSNRRLYLTYTFIILPLLLQLKKQRCNQLLLLIQEQSSIGIDQSITQCGRLEASLLLSADSIGAVCIKVHQIYAGATQPALIYKHPGFPLERLQIMTAIIRIVT